MTEGLIQVPVEGYEHMKMGGACAVAMAARVLTQRRTLREPIQARQPHILRHL